LRSNSLDKFSARRRQEQLERVGGVQRRSPPPPPPLTTSFKRSTFGPSTFGPSSSRTMNKDDDYPSEKFPVFYFKSLVVAFKFHVFFAKVRVKSTENFTGN